MLYLLWGLLNIGLFIWFIVICFSATKQIKEKFGLLTSIVFVFGLLSFIGGSKADTHNNEPNSNQIKTWKFHAQDSLDHESKLFFEIDLEETLISRYCLGIVYGKDKTFQNNIPVSATSWMSGFQSGTDWKPISILINRTDDNQKFEYEVNGTINWSLLGTTIYAQSKSWTGAAVLK